LTFDELYERACFIADGTKIKQGVTTVLEEDDLPF
jgi:hypothetical protein